MARKPGRPRGTTRWWNNPIAVAAAQAQGRIELWRAINRGIAENEVVAKNEALAEPERTQARARYLAGDIPPRRHKNVPQHIMKKLCREAIEHWNEINPSNPLHVDPADVVHYLQTSHSRRVVGRRKRSQS